MAGAQDKSKNMAARLRRISYFAKLSEYELRQIASFARVKPYAKGAVIIEELAEGGQFYIILTGKIEITKKYGDAEHFVLGVYSDGDFFGEMALLDKGRRSATVRAVEATTLLEIAEKHFQELLRMVPHLSYRILEELSSRLRTTGALLVSYLQQRNRRLRAALAETLRGIARAEETRSRGGDVAFQNTVGLAGMIGSEMGLSEDDLLVLEIRSLLHDLDSDNTGSQDLEQLESVGSEDTKPGRTDDSPSPTKNGRSSPPLEREIGRAFRGTYDKNDLGFPEDFLGTETYQVNSIISVADALATMMRHGSSGPERDLAAAVESIIAAAGNQFDGDVMQALLRLSKAGKIRGENR